MDRKEDLILTQDLSSSTKVTSKVPVFLISTTSKITHLNFLSWCQTRSNSSTPWKDMTWNWVTELCATTRVPLECSATELHGCLRQWDTKMSKYYREARLPTLWEEVPWSHSSQAQQPTLIIRLIQSSAKHTNKSRDLQTTGLKTPKSWMQDQLLILNKAISLIPQASRLVNWWRQTKNSCKERSFPRSSQMQALSWTRKPSPVAEAEFKQVCCSSPSPVFNVIKSKFTTAPTLSSVPNTKNDNR